MKLVDHESIEKPDTVMVVSKVDGIATVPKPKTSDVLKNLEQQKEIKIKSSMKTLTEEMLSTADKALVIKHLKKWMMDKLEEDIFLILGKKLHIWVDKTDLKTSELKTQVIRAIELQECFE